jgi:hypothetical protein
MYSRRVLFVLILAVICSSVTNTELSLEMSEVAEPLKKLRAFYATRRFVNALTRSRQ